MRHLRLGLQWREKILWITIDKIYIYIIGEGPALPTMAWR
jgi:hypothetical protein